MKNGLWRLVSGKEIKPKEEQALAKREAKAERAAGEIYLLVENDQRVLSGDIPSCMYPFYIPYSLFIFYICFTLLTYLFVTVWL